MEPGIAAQHVGIPLEIALHTFIGMISAQVMQAWIRGTRTGAQV